MKKQELIMELVRAISDARIGLTKFREIKAKLSRCDVGTSDVIQELHRLDPSRELSREYGQISQLWALWSRVGDEMAK
jgi:hypothetical protein